MNNKSDELLGRLFALLLLFALPAAMQAEDFQYTTNNGTVTITGYTGAGGDVIIPSTIAGLPVTSIGSSAFFLGTSITSVTIPDSVMSIGDSAFSACHSLTNVTIPNSVATIGAGAFSFCSRLTRVTIGNSVTSIGIGAFGLSGLNEITVDALNSVYSSVEGVLFNKSQTTLIQYPGGKGGGYTIPKGWMVLWAVHSTNQFAPSFAEPAKFDPERFATGRAEHEKRPHAFSPQGPGPEDGHRCPGLDYATLFISLFVVSLVRSSVQWSLAAPETTYRWNMIPPEPTDGLRATFTKA